MAATEMVTSNEVYAAALEANREFILVSSTFLGHWAEQMLPTANCRSSMAKNAMVMVTNDIPTALNTVQAMMLARRYSAAKITPWARFLAKMTLRSGRGESSQRPNP